MDMYMSALMWVVVVCGSLAVLFMALGLIVACVWAFNQTVRAVRKQEGCNHLSMVIVTSEDGWQCCYLDGRKFHTADRIAPWDVGMRRAGCTVTNRVVRQEWLDKRGGIYPQILSEVEFDDNPT